MLMFKLGNFKLQDFQRRANVAIFGQLLLRLFDKVLHFIQLAAGDAAVNGHAIKRNKRTAFLLSHGSTCLSVFLSSKFFFSCKEYKSSLATFPSLFNVFLRDLCFFSVSFVVRLCILSSACVSPISRALRPEVVIFSVFLSASVSPWWISVAARLRCVFYFLCS